MKIYKSFVLLIKKYINDNQIKSVLLKFGLCVYFNYLLFTGLGQSLNLGLGFGVFFVEIGAKRVVVFYPDINLLLNN